MTGQCNLDRTRFVLASQTGPALQESGVAGLAVNGNGEYCQIGACNSRRPITNSPWPSPAPSPFLCPLPLAFPAHAHLRHARCPADLTLLAVLETQNGKAAQYYSVPRCLCVFVSVCVCAAPALAARRKPSQLVSQPGQPGQRPVRFCPFPAASPALVPWERASRLVRAPSLGFDAHPRPSHNGLIARP